ncbi:hypothetical protein BC343_14975 [Mucilaginibacter pedocola]|uniref:Helix-turn-helix domain-containing protein n=1 Tax=Mucilaginibacter pedocola TaxID=1792845 RepID=A0A1S9P978_9SPHI|nr:hypothetical protein BC343_14975 [Mucilaginibacter pedocola]
MEIICMESAAFFELIKEVIERFKLTQSPKEDKWISGMEAMKMLRIKSKATLQKMRDEGHIRYSQPEKKIILYDVDSIHEYLEDFVYEPFGTASGKILR